MKHSKFETTDPHNISTIKGVHWVSLAPRCGAGGSPLEL